MISNVNLRDSVIVNCTSILLLYILFNLQVMYIQVSICMVSLSKYFIFICIVGNKLNKNTST